MNTKSSGVRLPKLSRVASSNTSHVSRPEEKTALAVRRLRSRLQSLRQHPVYGPILDLTSETLQKWLQVSGQDVFAADVKIRKNLELREKFKVDTLLEEGKLPKIVANGYPGGLCGIDREGSPVYYELCGLLQLKDIMKSAGRDAFIRFKFYQHELIQQYLKEDRHIKSKSSYSILVVVDLQFCQKEDLCQGNVIFLSEILNLLVDNYPALIKEIICINVPELPELMASQKFFKRDIWSMISLTGRKYITRLKKKVALSQLPVYLGGRKHCNGSRPFVNLDIDWSVKVPHLTLDNTPSSGASTYTIKPGIRKIEEYHVAAAGSALRWKFDVISHPVNLIIYFNSLGAQNRLLKSSRLTLDSEHSGGSLDCKVTGRYLFEVSNKLDLDSPAEVRYKVTATPPDSYNMHLAPMVHLVKPVLQMPAIDRKRREVHKTETEIYSSPNVDWLNSI